jgi:hypothetical protein
MRYLSGEVKYPTEQLLAPVRVHCLLYNFLQGFHHLLLHLYRFRKVKETLFATVPISTWC